MVHTSPELAVVTAVLESVDLPQPLGVDRSPSSDGGRCIPASIPLTEIPAGFHGDEAWTGIEGLRILKEGWIGPYTTSAMGQATGPFYLTALLIWLLDASRFSVRLSMGLFGIATIPAAHLLLRLGFGRWVALFGTTALTVSYWHLHFSRLGFGLISLAFVGTVAAPCYGR